MHLLQPGLLARNFLTSTCNAASSPPCSEPELQELEKFEAGKQSSATLSQHMRPISKRYACRVARTTRGKPDFDNFAVITLIVPVNKLRNSYKIQKAAKTMEYVGSVLDQNNQVRINDCSSCAAKY